MVARRLLAEFTGTGLLVAVVGSGIAAARLTSDGALRLLVNSLTTAMGLAVLILVFVQAGGAHFNPVATAAPVMACQIAGAIAGAALADAVFAEPVFSLFRHHCSSRRHHESGLHQYLRRDRPRISACVHRRPSRRRRGGTILAVTIYPVRRGRAQIEEPAQLAG